jgi:2'-5' RNA ligase
MAELELDRVLGGHRQGTVYASVVEGESAIIVPIAVPKAIHRLRERMDPSAAQGVPAHVTLIYPFMPVDALDVDVRIKLRRIVEAEPSFTVRFHAVSRFPNVVYLPPDPPEPFRRLTAALAAEFPAYPPYQGVYETVIPHLTVAQDVSDEYYAAAEHALPAALPVQDIVREAWLIGHRPDQPWHTLWRLPFGEPLRT